MAGWSSLGLGGRVELDGAVWSWLGLGVKLVRAWCSCLELSVAVWGWLELF